MEEKLNDVKDIINNWIEYCKLKGTNGGVVMNEEAVYEALVAMYKAGKMAGFKASGEGVNGEYIRSIGNSPSDEAIREVLEEKE